ncbi:MAG: efflux RND transporter periplasmic adaptor subunit [Myxococcales bacterium]|nr:efflux RND transporter periplasmic adaptor subunit [Myxococcales bacterium]
MAGQKKGLLQRWWWLGLGVAVAAVWALRPPKQWTATYAQLRDVVSIVVATGKMRARNQSVLSAELAAQVSKLLVDEGDVVKKNQKLVILYQSDLSARLSQARNALMTARQVLLQTQRKALPSQIHQAQADVLLAKSRFRQSKIDLARSLKLFKSNSISPADRDKALFAKEQAEASVLASQARLEQLREIPRPEDVQVARARVSEAEAALRTLQEQARKLVVRAPYDGVVVTRSVNLGQLVVPGTPLFVMADPASLEIFAEADENNLSQLQPGQKAIAIAPAYKKRPFAVELEHISPQVDAKRGVIGLRLKILQKPDFARIDLTVDVSIQTKLWPGSLSLPIQTLIMRENKPHVMTLDQGRTRLLSIQLRGQNPDWIVIENFSDKIPVLMDAQQLAEGERLRLRIQKEMSTKGRKDNYKPKGGRGGPRF